MKNNIHNSFDSAINKKPPSSQMRRNILLMKGSSKLNNQVDPKVFSYNPEILNLKSHLLVKSIQRPESKSSVNKVYSLNNLTKINDHGGDVGCASNNNALGDVGSGDRPNTPKTLQEFDSISCDRSGKVTNSTSIDISEQLNSQRNSSNTHNEIEAYCLMPSLSGKKHKKIPGSYGRENETPQKRIQNSSRYSYRSDSNDSLPKIENTIYNRHIKKQMPLSREKGSSNATSMSVNQIYNRSPSPKKTLEEEKIKMVSMIPPLKIGFINAKDNSNIDSGEIMVSNTARDNTIPLPMETKDPNSDRASIENVNFQKYQQPVLFKGSNIRDKIQQSELVKQREQQRLIKEYWDFQVNEKKKKKQQEQLKDLEFCRKSEDRLKKDSENEDIYKIRNRISRSNLISQTPIKSCTDLDSATTTVIKSTPIVKELSNEIKSEILEVNDTETQTKKANMTAISEKTFSQNYMELPKMPEAAGTIVAKSDTQNEPILERLQEDNEKLKKAVNYLLEKISPQVDDSSPLQDLRPKFPNKNILIANEKSTESCQILDDGSGNSRNNKEDVIMPSFLKKPLLNAAIVDGMSTTLSKKSMKDLRKHTPVLKVKNREEGYLRPLKSFETQGQYKIIGKLLRNQSSKKLIPNRTDCSLQELNHDFDEAKIRNSFNTNIADSDQEYFMKSLIDSKNLDTHPSSERMTPPLIPNSNFANWQYTLGSSGLNSKDSIVGTKPFPFYNKLKTLKMDSSPQDKLYNLQVATNLSYLTKDSSYSSHNLTTTTHYDDNNLNSIESYNNPKKFPKEIPIENNDDDELAQSLDKNGKSEFIYHQFESSINNNHLLRQDNNYSRESISPQKQNQSNGSIRTSKSDTKLVKGAGDIVKNMANMTFKNNFYTNNFNGGNKQKPKSNKFFSREELRHPITFLNKSFIATEKFPLNNGKLDKNVGYSHQAISNNDNTGTNLSSSAYTDIKPNSLNREFYPPASILDSSKAQNQNEGGHFNNGEYEIIQGAFTSKTGDLDVSEDTENNPTPHFDMSFNENTPMITATNAINSLNGNENNNKKNLEGKSKKFPKEIFSRNIKKKYIA